ncbi:hypothetical protein CE91St25_16780 [Campylobacter ureolyticus]|uniref:hypothetical protein n=1 Tax=Campylobacter ureolyticus TaxID=827 RepID=UPI001FC88052|nr:hypothetical protein [Campylobacter ureolyticus]GKH61342.1 hypothetical protein CE91St25_16780 [Campylobacter ureolyticus]
MSFEDILYNKDKEIEECKEFIRYIKEVFFVYNKDNLNVCILLELLHKKIYMLNSLKIEKYDQAIDNVRKIDEHIVKQIKYLKKEIYNDFSQKLDNKNTLKERLETKYNLNKLDKAINLEYYFLKRHKEYFKNFNIPNTLKLNKIKNELRNNDFFDWYLYKKSQEYKVDTILGIFNFIKNNRWLSTILFFGFGFIIYIFYFFKETTPFVFGQEFIYVVVSTSTIFLLIPIMFVIFVMSFYYLYISDKKDEKFKKGIFFYKSFFVEVLSFLLMNITILIFSEDISKLVMNSDLQIGFDEVIEVIAVMILVCIFYIFVVSILIKNQKATLGIFLFMLFFIFMISKKIGSINLFFPILFTFFGICLFYIILIEKDEKASFYTPAFLVAFSIILLGTTLIFIDVVYKKLNFGNIYYKYVILDKNAKLPNEICDDRYIKNIKEIKEMLSYCDENLTYKLENNEKKSIKIPSNCIAFANKDGYIYKTYNKKDLCHDNKKDINVSVVMPTYFIKKYDSIKLYNIKAITKIGSSWHIKAVNDFRFKIDKDHVKTEVE